MADQDDLAPLVGVALAFDVHLGDQRAGRVDHRQAALAGAALDRAGDAMRAEDRHAARRDLVDLVDEPRALGAQPLDDVTVVDDLVPDIDRRAVFLDRALDDLDRAFDSGAKPSGLCQHHSHHVASIGLVSRPGRIAAAAGTSTLSLPQLAPCAQCCGNIDPAGRPARILRLCRPGRFAMTNACDGDW